LRWALGKLSSRRRLFISALSTDISRTGSVANWDMASIQPEVAKQNDD